jgi:energy-coupling factor transporter ATP-binding protein EcfA2
VVFVQRRPSCPSWSRHVGVVLQNPDTQLLMPTVEDEVAFGLENLCLPPAEIDTRIEEALRLVGDVTS